MYLRSNHVTYAVLLAIGSKVYKQCFKNNSPPNFSFDKSVNSQAMMNISGTIINPPGVNDFSRHNIEVLCYTAGINNDYNIIFLCYIIAFIE